MDIVRRIVFWVAICLLCHVCNLWQIWWASNEKPCSNSAGGSQPLQRFFWRLLQTFCNPSNMMQRIFCSEQRFRDYTQTEGSFLWVGDTMWTNLQDEDWALGGPPATNVNYIHKLRQCFEGPPAVDSCPWDLLDSGGHSRMLAKHLVGYCCDLNTCQAD